MFDLAAVRVLARYRIINASAVSPYGREGTTRPEWFCAIDTQPSAADLFAMKTVLLALVFTFAPALCVAQADSAIYLDFRSRMHWRTFSRQVEDWDSTFSNSEDRIRAKLFRGDEISE
jgi:hypothetical protein